MQTLLFEGVHASGKTQALAAHAHKLAGAEGRTRILFVCAAPPCVESLNGQLPEGAACTTAQGLALSILQASGGRARLLAPHEQQILFEDMRSCGLPQKPLRRILDYLYANMASPGKRQEDWLGMKEERLVYDSLMANLAFTGGVVPAEASSLALDALKAQPGLADSHGADHILVDDFGMLNQASQMLCEALAKKSLSIAGEQGCSFEALDPYPNPAGLEEFKKRHPGTETVTLPDPGRFPAKQRQGFATVEEELAGIGAFIAGKLDAGMSAARIAVVGVNAAWRRNAKRALKAAGVPVAAGQRPLRLRDFTDEGSCEKARSDALEKLERAPQDGVALRTLLGLGDHLAGSTLAKRLREENPEKTLAQLVKEGIVDTQALLASPRFGIREEDGTEVARCNDGKQNDGVAVLAPNSLFGCQYDLVVFGGFLEGWVPKRAYFDAVGEKRETLRAEAEREISLACRAAAEEAMFTYFEECDLEFAEQLGLHYTRIGLKGGVRTCTLSPCKW